MDIMVGSLPIEIKHSLLYFPLKPHGAKCMHVTIETMAARPIVNTRLRSNSLISSTVSSSSLVDGGPGSSKKLTLVITGGSGWLGSAIAKIAYNHWEQLQAIKLFDSTPPDREVITGITGFSTTPDKPRVSYHHGNMLNEDDLLTCFAKADVVIHCAGLVERGSVVGRRRMRRVNVDGTHNVVQACLECGVRVLVFTGSVCQVLSADTTRPIQYDEQFLPKLKSELIFAHYGSSKNEAETWSYLLTVRRENKMCRYELARSDVRPYTERVITC